MNPNHPVEAPIDFEDIVTEDDTPVDGLFSEKEMRLLGETLHFWDGPGQGRPYVAAGNVGVFRSRQEPPLVPDFFISLDVRTPPDLMVKRNRSYFYEVYGKPPDLVVEIVSNPEGGETTRKIEQYAQWGVRYYIIHDPEELLLHDRRLALYESRGGAYEELNGRWLDGIGIGVTLWQGFYEGHDQEWLRWVDADGRILPTGTERAQEAQRREQEAQRREQEAQRRAEHLAARLRALGADPDENGIEPPAG